MLFIRVCTALTTKHLKRKINLSKTQTQKARLLLLLLPKAETTH